MLKKKTQKILLDNNLKILYNMSTSGDFFVKQCVDSQGKNFILKVRKRKSQKLKQQFINEIFINIFLGKFFKEKFPYEVIKYDVNFKPEYILYKMNENKPLNGYYFLIGKRNSQNYFPEKIIDLILSLQKKKDEYIKFNLKIKLDKIDYHGSLKYFFKYKDIYVKYFGEDSFLMAKKLIEINKKIIDNDLVLCHGDLNPKNILIGDNKNLTFIDWTNIHLGNPLSDIVRLYLASWNIKGKQKLLKKEAFKRINKSKRLFYLNIIILMGNFLKILDDSFTGIEDDYKKGYINSKTRIKLATEILKAREKSISVFGESFDYLSSLFLREKDFRKIISDFSDKYYVLNFLNNNKKQLKINNDIKNLELKIHHKRYKNLSKRLIVTYCFNDGLEKKEYTAKIRILKGHNLAYKSWFMGKSIWDSINDTDKYIPQPLYYFVNYGLFIYKTAKGKSFGEILKQQILSDIEKIKKIKIITDHLARLHKVNISKIENKKFLIADNIFTHINFLEKTISRENDDYKIRIKKAIKIVKKEIKRFSDIEKTLVHGDFQIENFIFDKNRMKLIDFDDSEINDPLVDVGNFLVQIFYGGFMGEKVDYFRELFLEKYLKYNNQLDKRFLNERLNLYIVIAKLKNISQEVFRISNLSDNNLNIIKDDLFKIERRLKNLKGNPLDFFKV